MLFGGIIAAKNGLDPRQWASPDRLLTLIDPYAVADVTGHRRDGPALLAQAIRWNTPESRHVEPPERCEETGRTIVGWIRLDNRAELCRMLGLENLLALSDEALILAAHRQWGRGTAARLEGEFSFAIHDPADHSTWCVRDVVGTRPFFYLATSEVFAFASTAALFRGLKGIRVEPSDAWIGSYLLGYSHDHHKTALEGVLRLPPAHEMLVQPGMTPQPQRYFAFEDPEPGIGEPDDQWTDRYRDALDRAVSRALRSRYPVAAELSGGIDSSAIVASAALQIPAGSPLHTLGLSMFEEDSAAQQEVVDYCDLKNHSLIEPHPIVWAEATAERANKMLGFPLEHANAGYHQPIYEECVRRNVRTLLSGFGGDEIVTSGGREVYSEALAAHRYRSLWRAVGSTTSQRARGVARLIRDRFSQSANSNHIESAFLAQLEAMPLSDAFKREHELAELQRERSSIFTGTTPNETILARSARAYVAGRFESCSAIAASYGIEYRWPLMNKELVQLFLTSPSIERHRNGIGRYLHRRSNVGRLPDNIVWHGKSMGRVRPEVRAEHGYQTPKNIDLLPCKLVSIVDHDKYLKLGESQKQASQAKVNPEQWDAFTRDLIRRIDTVSEWLSKFED